MKSSKTKKQGKQVPEFLLEHLCDSLQNLPADRRRSILVEQFLQSERLLLEQWMLARKVRASSIKGTSDGGQERCQRGHRTSLHSGDADKAVCKTDGLQKLVTSTVESSLGSRMCDRRMSASAPGAKRLRSINTSSQQSIEVCQSMKSAKNFARNGSRGILSIRQKDSTLYFVKLMLADNLFVRTTTAREFSLAQAALNALLAVREAVADVESVDLEVCLNEALHMYFWGATWNVGSLMHLRFWVVVSARSWIGQQLATPCFLDLGAALAAWNLLIEARGSTSQGNRSDLLEDIEADAKWTTLSSAYVAVCAQAGRSDSATWDRLLLGIYSLKR